MTAMIRSSPRPDDPHGGAALSDNDYPALYRAADAHSISQQRTFFSLLAAELTLLVLATVFSALNSSSASLAIAQVLVLLVTLVCVITLFWAKPDRHWYSARAVAESVKTVTWRYAMRAEPFDTDDKTAREHFGQRLKAIVEQNHDVTQRFRTDLGGAQITPRMDALRGGDPQERKSAYVEGRVVEQQQWYARKTAINDGLRKRFFWLLLAALFFAIGFAICRVQFTQWFIWPIDVFVALASVLLTWAQSKRFSELAASYALAAHEISIIELQAVNIMDDQELSKFVGDAENAFSREHTQWVARKDD